MEPVFKIDVSEIYSEGQELHVVTDGTYGMYIIKFKLNSPIPDALKGNFSKAYDAKLHCLAYLRDQLAAAEIRKRRKAVKVGKEKWALRRVKREAEVASVEA